MNSRHFWSIFAGAFAFAAMVRAAPDLSARPAKHEILCRPFSLITTPEPPQPPQVPDPPKPPPVSPDAPESPEKPKAPVSPESPEAPETPSPSKFLQEVTEELIH